LSVKRKVTRNQRVRKAWLTYAETALQYCRDVVSGKTPACKWVHLACQRHLDDLVQSRSKEYKYRFDPVLAGKRCAMVEKFPHVKGHWALHQELIKLEPWQCFITCSIFGWVSKETGLRRFRQAIILVPRKNAKTTWAAAIGLIFFAADGEPGSEVYTGATQRKQAFEVFSPASRMATRAAGFADWFGVSIGKSSMYIIEDGSKFEPVIGEPGDGPSPHLFIHDEFHEQPGWEQYNTAKTGMGARRQPLQLVISTAGVDIESPCHEIQEDLKKILQGDVINDRIFGVVYTVDDPEKWNTLAAAIEANPNYGVSVLEDYIKAELEEAIQRSSRQNSYKCKNLNIWVNARSAWMNMEKWKACAEPSLSIEEFLHEPCYEGYDLGARIDLTSRCKIFVRWRDGQKHYYLFARHYVPVDRANDGEHQQYERWLIDCEKLAPEHRFLVGHKGAEIQLAFVQKEVEDDVARFNYARLGFDPHQAMQMQQELTLRLGQDAQGNEKVMDIPQTWKFLDPAMKETEAAVMSGRLHHNGDPVLRWAISNVVVNPDANDNVFPRKENSASKIDPASALFNGMYLVLASPPPKQSVYATRGILSL
jgi:phage terminase large subunit-like protein